VRITFLGTGSGSTAPRRAGTAILVQDGDDGLLLDCGPRSFDRMVDLGISPTAVDGVLISHLHPDHTLGLPTLIQAMSFPHGKLPFVQGPRGTVDFVARATAVASAVTAMPGKHWAEPLPVEAEEVAGEDERTLCGFAVHSVVVPNVPNLLCLARRLERGGRSLVFSGDTSPAPDTMVPLAQGAHLLIHECWSQAGMDRWVAEEGPERGPRIRKAFETQHSEATAVARIAAEAGVKTLVLTHLGPGERAGELTDTIGAHFRGEIVVATDGLTLAI
jgi:ribonuclease BN (tRNA processing enzyme)